MTSTPSIKILQAQISDMTCGGCAKTITASLQQLPEVTEVSVSFATGRLNASFDSKLVNESAIRKRVVHQINVG